MSDDIPVMRIPISLPCNVPVLPGTPDTDAPIEQRTERCAVDAWWMLGQATICTLHLRGVLPDVLADVEADPEFHGYNATELLPWVQMHRYEQTDARPVWESAGGSR